MTDSQSIMETNQTRTTKRNIETSQFEYPAAATLTREEISACIEDIGIIPSVREATGEDALFLADALIGAGIPIVEVNMNAPEAVDLLAHFVKHSPTMIVGAGSLRNADKARRCIDAGAKFLSTDGLIAGVLEFAVKEKIALVAGALTLTEVTATWDAGADFVKVVPCYAVGGHNYIRTLKATVPQARLIAAGGVNQMTAQNYFEAGAAAVSLGEELIPTQAIVHRQAPRIQELARRFFAAVDKGRA